MIHPKHKHVLLLTISSLMLLLASNSLYINTSAHHNSRYRYHIHTKRYIKKQHSQKHLRFRYKHQTLVQVHQLLQQHYHVNFIPSATIRITHMIYGNHNLSHYRIRKQFHLYLKHHIIHYYILNRHFHKKYHRRHIHRRRYISKHQYYQWSLRRASNQGNSFKNILRQQLIKDINDSRRYYHRKPLRINLMMQKDADYRNIQTQYAYEHPNDAFKYEPNLTQQQFKAHDDMTDGWAHGLDNHTSGYDYLVAHHYHKHNLYWGANNGTWLRSKCVAQPDGSLDKWSDEKPRGIANNIDDQNINYDNYYDNHNGHRINELNPVYHYLGVGVTYNPKINLGTINEQFSN